MIRLVHPAPAGNGTDPSHRRHYPAVSLFFTEEEARHVRAAIQGVAQTYGGFTPLARALGIKLGTLTSKHPSAGVAVAVARHTGISLDGMLAGRLTEAGACPTCGGKRAAGAP